MNRNYTYKVITPPVNSVFTLDEIKLYLRLDTAYTTEDNLLTNMLNSAVSFVEKYTGRTLLTTGFLTYRDDFFSNYYNPYYEYNTGYYDYWELRKSLLQMVDSIQYYNTDNVLTTISTDVYYNTIENDYSKILLNTGYNFPQDKAQRLQSIEIRFTAGYGDTSDDIPEDLKEAILRLIALMYENRGDCSINSCSSLLDCSTKSLLSQFKIINI